MQDGNTLPPPRTQEATHIGDLVRVIMRRLEKQRGARNG